MPRNVRNLEDNFIYHILNRGNGKQEIFHKDQDYRIFVDLMIEAKKRNPIKLYAYCMMPNHFHMGIRVIKANDASKFIHWLTTTHARRYHNYYNTSGHIWQGRFKSFIVEEEVYFLTLLRYIEGNSVRAGLVGSTKDWLWSSHLERIGVKKIGLIDELPIELPKDWTNYINEPLTDKELDKIRQSVNRQSPLGSPEWQIRIAKKFGLESTIRPVGRPRKKNGKNGEKWGLSPFL